MNEFDRAKQVAQNILDYEGEPGILREIRVIENTTYARVRESHSGRELWRILSYLRDVQINYDASSYENIDALIAGDLCNILADVAQGQCATSVR